VLCVGAVGLSNKEYDKTLRKAEITQKNAKKTKLNQY